MSNAVTALVVFGCTLSPNDLPLPNAAVYVRGAARRDATRSSAGSPCESLRSLFTSPPEGGRELSAVQKLRGVFLRTTSAALARSSRTTAPL